MTAAPPSFDPAVERALKAIGACLAAAEAQVPKAAPPPSGRWRWLAEIPKWGPILTPIIVAVLGALLAYYLTGYFQQTLDLRRLELEVQKLALEQRQTDLSGIGQMRELVGELYRDGLTPWEAEATALSLAAFGGLAAPPLIQAIETGDAVRMTGAEVGLAAAALVAQGEICRSLAVVIDNRTALYNWQTQLSATKLLGRLGCEDQRLSLEAFGRLLDQGVTAYGTAVKREVPVHEVNDAKLLRLKQQQELALARLETAAKGAVLVPKGSAYGAGPLDRGSATSGDD